MTGEKEITCIVCPLGCKIVIGAEDNRFEILKGNKCKKGVEYAKNEIFDPRRMLTTSVLVKQGEWPLVSVKSSQPVPKEKIFSVMKELKRTSVTAPIKCGEILIKNIVNTGINIIATKTIKKVEKQ